MSNQVISLTSSDEEDNAEPPPKRAKTSPVLPECTLTLVPPKTHTDYNLKKIETVTLDSDDEITEVKTDSKNETTSDQIKTVEKSEKNTSSGGNNVDLISLTDDEEDIQPKVDKVNEIINSIFNADAVESATKMTDSSVQTTHETVSIDDSDTETEMISRDIDSTVDKSIPDIIRIDRDDEKTNNSIIIDDSDEETEKENHCENGPIESFPVHIEKTSARDVSSASTSKEKIPMLNNICVQPRKVNKELFINIRNEQLDKLVTNTSYSLNKAGTGVNESNAYQDEMEEAKALFKKFIKMVEEKIVDSKFEEILPKKVPIIKKYFNRSGTYVNEKTFKTLLTDSIAGVGKSSTANGANTAVLSFHKVFEHLKSHMAETTIIVEQDNLPKIKKLEQTIKLLRKRIHQLEVAEVNFDDDEDSAYIMLDRYQSRLNKVYAKYCQYIKRNPYTGRATYDRITFVNSSYNEINQALTKKYKNSLVFPSYYELEKYITKVSKRENLNLSEGEIKIESKKCFKVLGNILQKKRRQELYDSHLDFVEFSEDPATKDISLENVLKKNYAEGKEKIEKLYQKYVNKQERGEDKVSTDEEQSSGDSDDESNKMQKGKVKKTNKINIKKKEVDKMGKKVENKEKQDENENQIKNGQKADIKNESNEKDVRKKIVESQEGVENDQEVETKHQEDKKNMEKGSEKNQEDKKNQVEFLSGLNIQKVANLDNKEDKIENLEKNVT